MGTYSSHIDERTPDLFFIVLSASCLSQSTQDLGLIMPISGPDYQACYEQYVIHSTALWRWQRSLKVIGRSGKHSRDSCPWRGRLVTPACSL